MTIRYEKLQEILSWSRECLQALASLHSASSRLGAQAEETGDFERAYRLLRAELIDGERALTTLSAKVYVEEEYYRRVSKRNLSTRRWRERKRGLAPSRDAEGQAIVAQGIAGQDITQGTQWTEPEPQAPWEDDEDFDFASLANRER